MPISRGSIRPSAHWRTSRPARWRAASRCGASCRTRRRSSPIRSASARSQSAIPSARTRSAQAAGSCRSSRPMPRTTATSCCGDKERMVARRHGTILRTGQGMLLDETTLCATCWMHGVFAAQLTIGNTSFHKLFSVARDPYNITRSSGLRILIEAGGGWRLLAVPSAFEIGLSDCRWIYRLDERTVTVRALASGDDPALQWRITVEGEPCRLPGVRPPRPRRARARPRRPDRDRRGRQALHLPPRPGVAVGPALPGCGLPSGHQHARRDRDDRRRRAAVRRWPVAGRRLRGAADASDGRAALRDRGLDDRSGSGGTPRGQVRAWRRRSGDAGAGRTVLGAGHPRPADHRRRPRGRGARYHIPVVRAQRDGAPHRAARPGAVHRRRVGHARRLPGPGRVPARARARRAGQGDPADRLRAAVRSAGRLAAVVHARALRRDPRLPTATAT